MGRNTKCSTGGGAEIGGSASAEIGGSAGAEIGGSAGAEIGGSASAEIGGGDFFRSFRNTDNKVIVSRYLARARFRQRAHVLLSSFLGLFRQPEQNPGGITRTRFRIKSTRR
jgi:hypothetical protein